MADYGSVPASDHIAVIEDINAGKLPKSRGEINQIIKYAENGEWSWKLLGALGGAAMIGSGALNILSLNGFGVLLDFYIILFGFVAITIEFKETVLPASWVDSLRRDAKFMYKPYGRAVLYIFLGALLLSQQTSLYVYTGLYLLAVGGLVVYFVSIAQVALDTFKSQKLSAGQIKQAFDRADVDNTGLTPTALAKVVCAFPGNTMSESEMYSALSLLDKGSGRISYEEFMKWYG